MSNNNFKIAKDIVTSYEARVRIIRVIAEDTHKMLEEFRQKREKMADELREVLAKFQSLRKKDFDKMMAGILFAQKEREENIKVTLVNFQEQETAVVQNLKEILRKGKGLQLKDFKKVLTKIKKEQDIRQKENSNLVQDEISTMRQEVHKMLENFQTEREKVASEWKNMVALMADKRQANQSNNN